MADSTRSRSNSFHSVGASASNPPGPQPWPATRGVASVSARKRTNTPEARSTSVKRRSPSVLRHGSGAGMPTPVSEEDTVSPGSRMRERSRDRPLSASAQARADEHAGEGQRPRSTLAAIDRLEVVVAALDQVSHSQARTISTMSNKYLEIQNRVKHQASKSNETNNKIKTTDSHLLEACGNIIV